MCTSISPRDSTLFCSFSREKRITFHDVCFSKPLTFHNDFMFFASRSCFKHFSRQNKPYLRCEIFEGYLQKKDWFSGRRLHERKQNDPTHTTSARNTRKQPPEAPAPSQTSDSHQQAEPSATREFVVWPDIPPTWELEHDARGHSETKILRTVQSPCERTPTRDKVEG